MQCYVYKGENKEDHFLYLAQEFDHVAQAKEIPAALLDMLGELSLVIEFDLSAKSKLPNADIEQVKADINDNGFYLQMPKQDMHAAEELLFS